MFSLPVWVVIWMLFVLIPVNLSGYFLLHYDTGFWVAVLGGTAILLNTVIIFANGGFSKVLAIPHLALWLPLEIILLQRLFGETGLSGFEQGYLLTVLAVNGISLLFDFYDTAEWYGGNRAVAGYKGEPVWL